MDRATYAIVGAGQAGGRAAETLRKEGFAGRIVLIGAEHDRPYERPPLSKGFLLGTTPAERIFLHQSAFYQEHEIELLLGTSATRLQPERRLLTLSDDSTLSYDKLLIATGVRAHIPNVPGTDLPGIHTLRTLRDAESLSQSFDGSPRVAIVGAGFIGAEVAAACRACHLEVTLIERLSVPLEGALDWRIGQVYAAIHRDEGVDLRLGATVAAFQGVERVEAVVLEGGETIPCDLALIAAGSTPNVEFLAGSGLGTENGVTVDAFCRTVRPEIVAAGDVARWWHAGYGEYLRVEHWDNAEQQGAVAARAMLDLKQQPYAPTPYFWSDQYRYALQYLGHHHPDDALVVRGSLEARSFIAFYVRGSVPVAALILNRPRDGTAVRKLLATARTVDPHLLLDETVELRSLIARKT